MSNNIYNYLYDNKYYIIYYIISVGILIFLKTKNIFSENAICLLYKLFAFFSLLVRNYFDSNILRFINNTFIPYYIYSIYNHRSLSNKVHIYMVIHHIICLIFLINPNYSPKLVTLFHGNLLFADLPNTIFDYFNVKNINARAYADFFFIYYKFYFIALYKLFFIKSTKKIIQIIFNVGVNDYNQNDIFVKILPIIMGVAIYFKIERLRKKKIIETSEYDILQLINLAIVGFPSTINN